MSNNVFVKNIPKDIKNEELEKKFEHIGKVKSLKISLNSDHSSRGYGFICFQEEESAQKAIEFSKND
jgi:polyadenylate-binding protein